MKRRSFEITIPHNEFAFGFLLQFTSKLPSELVSNTANRRKETTNGTKKIECNRRNEDEIICDCFGLAYFFVFLFLSRISLLSLVISTTVWLNSQSFNLIGLCAAFFVHLQPMRKCMRLHKLVYRIGRQFASLFVFICSLPSRSLSLSCFTDGPAKIGTSDSDNCAMQRNTNQLHFKAPDNTLNAQLLTQIFISDGRFSSDLELRTRERRHCRHVQCQNIHSEHQEIRVVIQMLGKRSALNLSFWSFFMEKSGVSKRKRTLKKVVRVNNRGELTKEYRFRRENPFFGLGFLSKNLCVPLLYSHASCIGLHITHTWARANTRPHSSHMRAHILWHSSHRTYYANATQRPSTKAKRNSIKSHQQFSHNFSICRNKAKCARLLNR